MEKPVALLFDWDNTLVDSWQAIYTAFNATLEAMGHEPWDVARARAHIGPPADQAFPPLFGEDWRKAEKIYHSFFEQGSDKHRFAKPLPGAEQLLSAAAELDVFMAVISNKRGPNLRAEAAHLGWNRFFSLIVGAGDAQASKPDPAPMLFALTNTGIEPGANVWYIGDHHTDLLFARNSGCKAVLLNGHDLDQSLLAQMPPLYAFKGCTEFEGFLRENYLF